MTIFKKPSRIIVTCSKRLSPYLMEEITSLGFAPIRAFPTGVELHGTLEDCIRLNLHLRCASQVLYSIREFRINHPDELYKAVMTLPWEDWLEIDGYFSVTSHVDHPTITTPLFANVKVKDSIVDRIRKKTGKRPDSGAELRGAVVHLFWKDHRAEIFFDTSGETLAKHGYRKIPGKAPMLEALAAATLLATRWDRQSPFINPMCGSSTVAIEAAMLATNRKPGLYRTNYSFMHIVGYKDDVYATEYRQIEDQILTTIVAPIIASDINEDAIRISKMNAATAGVENLISFEVCDFASTHVPESPGVVYFNPEYGERLGEVSELEDTYARIGDFLKQRCKGYTGYIFTGNLELAKKIGLKPSRRIEFYTSTIDSRLLEYELYAGSKKEKVSVTL